MKPFNVTLERIKTTTETVVVPVLAFDSEYAIDEAVNRALNGEGYVLRTSEDVDVSEEVSAKLIHPRMELETI